MTGPLITTRSIIFPPFGCDTVGGASMVIHIIDYLSHQTFHLQTQALNLIRMEAFPEKNMQPWVIVIPYTLNKLG